MRALHLRERELSGYSWYSRESSGQASPVADAAVFEFRMVYLGRAAAACATPWWTGSPEGILAEAREWDAAPHRAGQPAPR